MRFGLLQECEVEMGSTHYFRTKELVKEVQHAEEMGFDFWGTSEQHFVSPLATVTAPEVLFGYMAARTSRIRFRHMVTLLPFNINHPIRVAERIATLDVVSDGRAELGMGRSNHLWQLDPFGIKATETRPQMLEAMEIIDKALVQDEFEHDGPLLKIPRRRLSPKPVQNPRPPMFIIASSVESHQIAAERGLGVISFDNWRGWYHIEEQAEIYKNALPKAKPMSDGSPINRSMGACAITGFCDENMQRAKEIAGPVAYSFLDAVLALLYGPLAKASKDYEYMGKIATELEEVLRNHDIDALLERTPSCIIGTPDYVIEKIKRLERIGYNEVVMRMDGFGHENIMKSLTLMGKYVIPEFKRPTSIVRVFSIPGRVA